MSNNSFADAVINEVAGIEALLARLETALEEHDLKTQQKLEEQLKKETVYPPQIVTLSD